jgi:hypothetical protein
MKPTDKLTDSVSEAFMNVSNKSNQNNYKKRCSMDKVNKITRIGNE